MTDVLGTLCTLKPNSDSSQPDINNTTHTGWYQQHTTHTGWHI